jgi:hypothetical protein
MEDKGSGSKKKKEKKQQKQQQKKAKEASHQHPLSKHSGFFPQRFQEIGI